MIRSRIADMGTQNPYEHLIYYAEVAALWEQAASREDVKHGLISILGWLENTYL